MTSRRLSRIIATTDVHSALDGAVPLLAHLDRAYPDALIVDCGDWFEGTGYYQLGQGHLERQIITDLYDVVAPGNHGWKHYVHDPDLHQITVCANVVDTAGTLLFRTLHRATVAGHRVGVTAVIGEDAFDAIRVDQKTGHHLIDPAHALTGLLHAHGDEIDSWVVLSHSGFDRDTQLAAEVPHVDVIFAGHCHSNRYGPIRVADTLIVKGRERAAGYAQAEPTIHGWRASSQTFPSAAALPRRLQALDAQNQALREQLAAALGRIDPAFRHTTPDRHQLLLRTADALRREHGLPVLLSDTTLRPGPLGEELLLSDLLALEPFANHLVIADVPAHLTTGPGTWHAWLDHIAHPDLAGPLVCSPDALPPHPARLLTSDYLAYTFLAGPHRPAGIRMADAIRATLTGPRP
jgi:hypothetical protein